jgi:hypothetical protein
MSYIGSTPTTQGFIPAIDFFSGNGSTVAFTLSRPVASVAQVQATIENVPQNPGTAFTVSGNTITFDGAPASGTNNIYVYYTSPITQVIAPSQGTVFPSTLSTGGPFWNTSGNVGIGTTSPTTGRLVIAQNNSVQPAISLPTDESTIQGPSANTQIRMGGNLVMGGAGIAQFNTNGTERMRIDSAGRVTTPSQPAFYAVYANGYSYTISPSNRTPTYGTTLYNIGNHYNTSTSRFTAPVTGLYEFTVSVGPNGTTRAASGFIAIEFSINGTSVTTYSSSVCLVTGIAEGGMNTTYRVSLNAGDYISTYIYSSPDSVTGGSSDSWTQTRNFFSGYLLG